jgi:hypothetical protein
LVICPPPLVDLSNSQLGGILVGAEEKSRQLPSVLKSYCDENSIRLFNAGDVVQTSPVDGVHWEADEHKKLGIAVAGEVREILS